MQFSLGPMYMEKNTRLRTCTSLQNQTNHQQVPSQLLYLPFLPAEPLQPIFKDIRDLLQPSQQEGLHKLLQYIDDNWINGPTFKIAKWTVYGQPIRTNNDTEGWHHHLNTLCKGLGREKVNLYQLIEVLHKESQMVTTQAQLVIDEKLQRYQRTTYRQYQHQVFQIWDDYSTKKLQPRHYYNVHPTFTNQQRLQKMTAMMTMFNCF